MLFNKRIQEISTAYLCNLNPDLTNGRSTMQSVERRERCIRNPFVTSALGKILARDLGVTLVVWNIL